MTSPGTYQQDEQVRRKVWENSRRRKDSAVRKHSKKGTGKHLNSRCKQCTREQEPKVDGTEERHPVGVYRNTSTAARVKKERIVLERGSGPRPEARKEDKGKRKVAKVRTESAGAVGRQDTLRQIVSR